MSERRKNCNIGLMLSHPSDWALGLHNLTYSKYITLDKKVTATQKTSIWLDGEGKIATQFSSRWIGPLSTALTSTDELHSGILWLPDDKHTLHINTQFALDNSQNIAGSGMIKADPTTGKHTVDLGFGISPC
ncbi:hypothetical protein BDZ91DRAFT_734873 [Kalaharituber pfeilii]|nr:hypothetical protein BDZ91DRAFT_734873 [Kalaharituber pfeilii]